MNQELREKVADVLEEWYGTDAHWEGTWKEHVFGCTDAIMQAVEEDRAALMAVAEKNEEYEEAIERDRDKWRKACEQAEAREVALVEACNAYKDLLACYRLGTSPTAKLFDALERADAALVKEGK